MRRLAILLGAALVGFAFLPSLAQAQVIVQYGPPVIVTRPSYYVTPSYYVAPSITTYSSSYAPSVSYYPPTTVYSYSAPAPIVTYSAPATVLVPAGVVETRSYYGLGIFRPRGYYTQTRYYP